MASGEQRDRAMSGGDRSEGIFERDLVRVEGVKGSMENIVNIDQS